MKKYLKNLNIFILSVLFLLGFSAFYFLYYRQRSQANIFVEVGLVRGQQATTGALSAVPFWLDQAISIGDKEISPLGGMNAEVYDKISYSWYSSGQMVYLYLRVNAIRDRSGIYLYKNKPLSIGASIDLKLPKAQVQGLVVGIAEEKIIPEFQKLTITVFGKGADVWIANNLKAGSTVIDNKGQTLARVLSVNVSSSTSIGTLIRDANTNKPILVFDSNERDVDAKVELTVRKIGSDYYFGENQRVRVGEQITLPFQEVIINAPVTSIIASK